MLLARTALNLQFRVVYPFLPAIGRGLGVPLETASLLLTARRSERCQPFSARRPPGPRTLMLAGLAALVGRSHHGVGQRAGPLGFAGAGGLCPVRLQQGRLRPGRAGLCGRCRALCAAGPGDGPVGAAVVARLVHRRAAVRRADCPLRLAVAVLAIALAGTAGLLALWRQALRGGVAQPTGNRTAAAPTGVPWRAILRISLPVLLVSLLLVMAMENVFIVYGAWLEGEFGLAVSTIGAVSIVISLAEMLAEGLSAGLVDRLGKRRAVWAASSSCCWPCCCCPPVRHAGDRAGGMALFICSVRVRHRVARAARLRDCAIGTRVRAGAQRGGHVHRSHHRHADCTPAWIAGGLTARAGLRRDAARWAWWSVASCTNGKPLRI